MNIDWQICVFEELTKNELYQILHLRSAIFVVEQADIYLDADHKDQDALHLMGIVGGRLVAYSRIFARGMYHDHAASFGRVLVVKEYRTHGVGSQLIEKVLSILQEEELIKISAQLYLQTFYENFGFVAHGKPYLDGTIEHVDMQLMKTIRNTF